MNSNNEFDGGLFFGAAIGSLIGFLGMVLLCWLFGTPPTPW